MSTDKDPRLQTDEGEPTAPLEEQVIRKNLRSLTGAMQSSSHMFGTLWLLAPEDDPQYASGDHRLNAPLTLELRSDCDARNRAILDKIYEVSHVDVEAAETILTQSDRGSTRVRTLHSPHGFTVEESYVCRDFSDSEILRQMYGDQWECFRVNYVPDKDKQPDFSFLFAVDPV